LDSDCEGEKSVAYKQYRIRRSVEMTRFGLGLVASLAVLASASAASAADPIMIVDEPAMAMAMGSSWDGPYVGVGGAFLSSTTIVETIGSVFGVIGANAVVGDNFLLGAEAYLSGNFSSLGGAAYYALGAAGRAGVIVSDPVLLYGALGAEYVDGGNTYATVGGGAEFSVTADLSLDVEYKYYIGLNNAWQGHSISASANWHF